MPSILNLGLTGLNVYQRALETTAHNITNVNTPGFSRQNVVITARPAASTGAGFSGSGVEVDDIRRTYDQHIVEQLRVQTSATKGLEVQGEMAARLQDLYGDSSAGLSPALQQFFDSVDNSTQDPTSIAARQVMLSDAENLVSRFREMQARIDNLHGDLTTRMKSGVSEMNALAGAIADVNNQLVSGASGGTHQPNDLLDQRDELLRQLAERIDISTVDNGDGSINVMIGSGHALVMRTEVNELAVARNANDSSKIDVVIKSAESIALGSTITGGEIGGLLGMQSGFLDAAEREMGRLALAVADGYNKQHQLGMDLSGRIGGSLFTDINDPLLQDARAISNAGNTGNAGLVVAVDDIGALADSDYRLDFDGTDYRLTQLSDETVVSTFAGFPQTFATQGFSIDMGTGAAAAGDSFVIRPTAGIVQRMEVQIDDPRAVALADPVRTQSSLDNLGDAQISSEGVSDLAGVPLANAITLTFDQALNQFTVSAPPGGTLAYDPATENGKEFTLSPAGFGDLSFSLSGAPADGDTFTIESNQGGVGDNRNGLELGNVRLERPLNGGTVSINEAFGLMLADIGSRSRHLDINYAAQNSMLSQVQAEREAVSGVNLDEEAVNLMRYQQAYEASAQVISVANELFQVLLRASG